MTMKKMSLSAIALSTILLTVGCTSNDNSEHNINTNTEVSTETVEAIKSKYSNNIEVKVFFDLAEKAQNITALEFIDEVKAIDVNKTLTIEKIEESGNDNTPSVPYINCYEIKPSTGNTELRVVFTEFKDDNQAKKIGVKNHKIESITLMLHDENLTIANHVPINSYSVTLQSVEPIVTKENISEFKKLKDYDEKFFKLQDKLIDNKNMTTEDIEKLWNQKFEHDVECFDSTLDMPYGKETVSSILLQDQNGSILSVLLNDKNELVSATCAGDKVTYGYHATEAFSGSETIINDYQFRVGLFATDKTSLISQIEKLYNLKI